MSHLELEPQASVWSQVLQDFKVKLESLESCYRRAMRDHRERFPITVTDMLAAQEKLWAEEPPKMVCQFCEWKKQNPDLPDCKIHGKKVESDFKDAALYGKPSRVVVGEKHE